MPLSDTAIRNAKPAAKPQKLADGGGLYLLLNPNGSRWWRLKYRVGGKEKLLSLGTYPDTGLKDARDKRDAARKLLAAGVDPGEQRKAAKAAGEERAAIEMLDEVPEDVAFEFADEIFQGLSNLRPRLVTRLLASCRSVRAKRLFLFYADRHGHAWCKHVDRSQVDLGKGKRQLVAGGRLDARYQITVPLALSASREDGA